MHPAPRRALRALHRHVAVPVLRFALPTACFVCRRPLERFQHLGACLACWGGFTPVRSPACPTCALPRPATSDLLGPANGRCARCIVDPPSVTAVRAAVIYDERARAFLLRAKLAGHRDILRPLGLQVAAAPGTARLARGCQMVVPVPSHPLMTLRRGFRPAALLARIVAAKSQLPCRPALLRVHWRARLVAKRLGARDRRSRGRVFAARTSLNAQPVLLVDDVMTTGASLEACAGALLRAGASEVRAVVWARRLPHP